MISILNLTFSVSYDNGKIHVFTAQLQSDLWQSLLKTKIYGFEKFQAALG